MDIQKDIALELERAKITNYILQEENELLLGTIGMISKEKETLLFELEEYKKSKTYKIMKKIKSIIKK